MENNKDWQDIPGLPGYQRSSDGFRVRSVDRVGWYLPKYGDRVEVLSIRDIAQTMSLECGIKTFKLYAKAHLGREISLNEQPGRKPYYRIFGTKISGARLWKAVYKGIPIETPHKAPIYVEIEGRGYTDGTAFHND